MAADPSRPPSEPTQPVPAAVTPSPADNHLEGSWRLVRTAQSRSAAGGHRRWRRDRNGGPLWDGIRHPAFGWRLSHGDFPLNIVDAVLHGAADVLPTGWLPAHKLTRPTIGTGCDGLTSFQELP